jgi:hypothetical protein
MHIAKSMYGWTFYSGRITFGRLVYHEIKYLVEFAILMIYIINQVAQLILFLFWSAFKNQACTIKKILRNHFSILIS